jgi:oxygen-dependent protoporphyrinogen oxidase
VIAAKRAKPTTDAKPKRRRSISFREGMNVLPASLAIKLGENLTLGCEDLRMEVADSKAARFVIGFNHSGGAEQIACPHLVIATPAPVAASLIGSFLTEENQAHPYAPAKELSQLLREIDYPPLAILYLAYDKSSVAHPLDGFGFLAVPGERLHLLGCIFSSSQFAGRAPQGKALFTIFIGGARNPELTDLDDDALVAKTDADLQKILGLSSSPRLVSAKRWQRAIPQYNVGHAGRVRRLEALTGQIKGLYLSGNYLHGVSIGDCVTEADHLAQTIFRSIRG